MDTDCTLLQATNYWKNAKQQRLPFTLDPRVLYRGYVVNTIQNGIGPLRPSPLNVTVTLAQRTLIRA